MHSKSNIGVLMSPRRLGNIMAFSFAISSLMGCTSAAQPDRSAAFKQELSRAIEQMLREQQRLGAAGAQPSEPDLLDKTGLTDRLVMPVSGVTPAELQPSFGDHRSGGRRHMGIDIFATRGTAALAVADGRVSYLGTRSLAGRCIWLEAQDGRSYFYAHLDGWVPGLWQGQRVRAGEPLGYVGNSGNASGASPHLHFEMHQHGAAVDPFPILREAARPMPHATAVRSSGPTDLYDPSSPSDRR
jgi:murein DD-endopeptidase MepM/ murein hydrolase activator NlpD